MTLSVSILHARRKPERVRCLAEMMIELRWDREQSVRVWDDPLPEGRAWNDWQHDLHPRVWQSALDTGATHHLFMTDDLNLAPGFLRILSAMLAAKPSSIVGLLSNHPAGPTLADAGLHWYRCAAWVVGPAYVVPDTYLRRFWPYYRAWLPTVDRTQYGDDSALNEWICRFGPGETWHPLPTIIEHRGDIGTTWIYGGDCFSRERVSWRAHRHAPLREQYKGAWTERTMQYDLAAMAKPEYWMASGPLLRVVGATEDEGSQYLVGGSR